MTSTRGFHHSLVVLCDVIARAVTQRTLSFSYHTHPHTHTHTPALPPVPSNCVLIVCSLNNLQKQYTHTHTHIHTRFHWQPEELPSDVFLLLSMQQTRSPAGGGGRPLP